MKCVRCEKATFERCIECGDPYCSTHSTLLCPMCYRIKQFKREQAQNDRVVWWQYADEDPLPRDLGAITAPMPTVKLQCA